MSTIYAKLVACKEDPGGYVKYVFQNIENGEYLLCTKFPNWETPPIKIFATGYLKYKEIIAGKETWYDHVSGTFIPYKYDTDQFIDFVEERCTSDCIIL